ncbi:MAG: transcriptional repressor [Alphaproteobacteria bacterium]|nr:transcriptional repressor [Alphaproteobacteria bacterium]MCW5739889.1 transcriptional repressor [Alphaproteobacteria bacterium]
MVQARSQRSHLAPADPAHDHRLCVADALSVADRVCAERGTRFTDLRRRVFELVWASHKPVGAYAVLETLRSEGLGSAPPTVYRALDFLLEHELVHRIESLNAFVGCAHPGERHRGFFLICTQCGNAEELDDERLNTSIARAADARGFTARHTTLEVAGTCASCRVS